MVENDGKKRKAVREVPNGGGGGLEIFFGGQGIFLGGQEGQAVRGREREGEEVGRSEEGCVCMRMFGAVLNPKP